jgi:hypothetical protein
MGNTTSSKCKMFTQFAEDKMDIDNYNDKTCAICLVPLIKNGDCKKNCKTCETTEIWTCHHQFHKSCINEWKNHSTFCPLCRCEEIINDTLDTSIYDKITFVVNDKNYIMENCNHLYNNNFPLTLSKYVDNWNYDHCDNQYDNHRVSFFKVYGVLGCCSCGSTQSFNYLE